MSKVYTVEVTRTAQRQAGSSHCRLLREGREHAMWVSRRKGTVNAKVLRQECTWCSRKSKAVRVAEVGSKESGRRVRAVDTTLKEAGSH